MPQNKSTFVLSGVDKTTSAFNSVQKNLGSVTRALTSTQAAVAGLIGAAGFGALLKGSLETGDKLQKLSIRLKESTEALSQYQHVAEITGVSFDDITNSFAKLQKGISDAADGLSAPKTALDDLGLSVETLLGLRPSQQFEMIADAIKTIEDPAKRTQIAMDLMGRSGSRMLSTMEEGGEGIRKLREEYDAMGGTLSQVDANQIASANDAITRIGAAARITGQMLAVTLADDIESLANKIKGWLPDIKKFFDIFKSDEEKLVGKFERLTTQIEETKASIQIMQQTGADGASLDLAQAQLDLLNLQDSLDAVNRKMAELGVNKPVEFTQDYQVFGPDLETEKSNFEKYQQMLFEHNQVVQGIIKEHQRLVAVDEMKMQQERLSGLEWVTGQLLALEDQRTQGAIYLMQALGQKSKGFAIAAFLAEKAIAIKRILVQTNVAAVAALTPPPIGLGPVAGAGLAAKIKAAGATNALLTGAASIAEGINRFGGGETSSPPASIGGGAGGQPIGSDATANAQTSSELHIHLDLNGKTMEEIVVHGFPAAINSQRLVVESSDGVTYHDIRIGN